jgi:hypothetical protein
MVIPRVVESLMVTHFNLAVMDIDLINSSAVLKTMFYCVMDLTTELQGITCKSAVYIYEATCPKKKKIDVLDMAFKFLI